jgi:hypothetical protein
LKRVTAAFMIFLGLTAVMIGFYLDELQSLSTILRSYIMQLL